MSAERILVVDDEPGVRSVLEPILTDEGFDVVTVASGEDALAALDRDDYDAILLDIWLPGMDGLDTLRELRERNHDAEVVMISGHGTIETAVKATKFGAFDFIEKPLSLDRTLLVVRNALRQRRLLRSNRQLLEQLGRDTEIVGSGTRTEQLREMIRVAAASDAPVLICGEPGSGRENVARRIHASGRRSDGPFVEIPCGALDGDAAREALGLGETGGGRVALAAGGTLFLEDVDRLENDLQRRIAAALLAGTRQGSDIRLLASAPADAAGVEGDLRRLLDVIRVDVPRLADRREDIPLLVERLMHDLSREYGKTPKRLERRALAALRAHPWPGNLRQLRNLVERLVVTAAGDTITVADLPADHGGEGDSNLDLYGDFGGLSEGVAVFVQYHVRRAMLQAGGDAKKAAKALGITKRELLEKLKED